MNLQYADILSGYIAFTWKILCIPIIVLLVIFIVCLIKNRHNLKSKKVVKGLLTDVFLLVCFLALGAVETVPAYLDIKENATAVVPYESAYYYNQSDDVNIFKTPILVVLNDGTQMELGDASLDFPFETANGTITYAKHSKIILDYTGTVVHEDRF